LANMILLAGEIPFAIVVLAVLALTTVRYHIKDAELRVYMLGMNIRKIPLNDIVKVESVRVEDMGHWCVFHRRGMSMVVVHTVGGRPLAFSHSDAEQFSERLKEGVFKRTGRKV